MVLGFLGVARETWKATHCSLVFASMPPLRSIKGSKHSAAICVTTAPRMALSAHHSCPVPSKESLLHTAVTNDEPEVGLLLTLSSGLTKKQATQVALAALQ